jgi:hypothetical protein
MSKWNLLMDWLSAQTHGTMEQFRHMCEQLDFALPYSQVRRHLQLLGHLDLRPGGKAWSIGPAAVVQRPDGQGWFLAGQRNTRLAQMPGLQVTPQAEGPDHWGGTGPVPVLPGLEVREAGCVAKTLLAMLIPLDTWIPQLVDYPLHAPLSEYTLKFWDGAKFVDTSPAQRRALHRGLYQLKRNVGRYESEIKLYCESHLQPKPRFVVADFTGLKFVDAYHSGDTLAAVHHPMTHTLWVPQRQQWPFIYERTLILCSGYLPTVTHILERPEPYLCYRHIPADFVSHYGRVLLDIRPKEIQEFPHV